MNKRRVLRFSRDLALAGMMILLSSCSNLLASRGPTSTPFTFVTATLRPASTARPPATVTIPPPPTQTSPPPQPTLRGSPLAPTLGAEEPTAEPTPTVLGVEGTCPFAPEGGFGTIFESDPGLPSALGCPTSSSDEETPQAWIVNSRWQTFERGALLWTSALGWDSTPVVYAINDDGSYLRLDDTYNPEVDPVEGPEIPPQGLFEPVGSLGKAWREGPGVSARLGWATAPESNEFTWMQPFSNGEMVMIVPVGQIYVFKRGSPDTWQTYDVSF